MKEFLELNKKYGLDFLTYQDKQGNMSKYSFIGYFKGKQGEINKFENDEGRTIFIHSKKIMNIFESKHQ